MADVVELAVLDRNSHHLCHESVCPETAAYGFTQFKQDVFGLPGIGDIPRKCGGIAAAFGVCLFTQHRGGVDAIGIVVDGGTVFTHMGL